MKLNLRHCCKDVFDGGEIKVTSSTSKASKADIIKALSKVYEEPSYKAWLEINSNGKRFEMVKAEGGTVYLEEYYDSLGHSSNKAVNFCEALIDLNRIMSKEAVA